MASSMRRSTVAGSTAGRSGSRIATVAALLREPLVNRPSALLLDLDGVLLDTEPLYGEAWREVAAALGGNLDDRQLLSLRGRRRADCAARVAGWLGQPNLAEELATRQHQRMQTLLPRAPAMPGAASLLERCRLVGVATVLVTSSFREAATGKLAPHPWLRALEHHVYGDDPEVAAGKPAPDAFLVAARRVRAPPSGCWAVEDSPAGAQAAAAAGCTVWVLLAPGLDDDAGRRQFPASSRFVRHLDEVLPADPPS